MHQWLQYSAEIEQARRDGAAIVALETTIISHGMPYPQNVQTAREVEAIVRANGAVPATIGLIDGTIRIGLNDDELEAFGSTPNVEKVSRRDFAHILASKRTGATTVAGTMIGAALAGIRVFATGGIGGVHREGETSMDISADLIELAQTNVAVVCAGVKSILDIGRTLEYLETHGVPVVGYQTAEFPSFYSRKSGFGVDYRLDTPEQVADMLACKWELGINGGAVIANPVPEADALPFDMMETVIGYALDQAKQQHIKGKDVTPFLLGAIKELTKGQSLVTNIALVKHNAEVAAQIAVALNKLA